MASSLFSSANPFRRKSGDVVDAPVLVDASTRKRKNVDDDEDSKVKRPKSIQEAADQEEAEAEAEVDDVSGEDEGDEQQGYDSEEKMQRTIFVGNLPLSTKKKALAREFSCFGAIESARLRSVPLADTKVPRRGAVITGQVSENRSSLNGYVVFKDVDSARAALTYNMREFGGKHIRVDIARPRSQFSDGNVKYDNSRSIFVGNLPSDVEDEELHALFSDGSSEADLEAVRVVRDPKTNVGKGIAFVLFKTKAGVKHTFDRGALELRGRKLRIHRVANSRQEKPARQVRQKRANPRRNRRPIPDDKIKGRQSYEGTRANEKKQRRAPTKAPAGKPKAEKSESKKKRPAVAARKAQQKGLEVPETRKKPSHKKKAQ